MSKKIFQSTNQNKEQHKESHRPASLVPTIPVDVRIHGSHAGSIADKARQNVASGTEADEGRTDGE